jgi:radical SAM superfamily enzyme YgiQ (UPF0313 family)
MRVTLVGTAVAGDGVGAASARYNLATACLEAALRSDPALAGRVEPRRIDLPVALRRPALPSDAAARVLSTSPDVVGLSCYAWDVDLLVDLARLVKAAAPGVRVVAGGPSATLRVGPLLAAGSPVDVVVRGEGERTFAALLGGDIARPVGVAGLSFRDDTGAVRHELDRPLVEDLDTLPSPLLAGVLAPPRENLMLELSRGCRRRCAYCAWKLRGAAIRRRSEARVADEIAWAVERGYEHAFVIDSALNGDDRHLESVARAVHRADPARSLAFSFFVDAARVDAAQVRHLAALRAHEMTVGLETTNPDAARAVGRRPTDVESFSRALDALSAVGPATLSIILGLPGDTAAGFARTLDACAALADGPPPGRVRAVRVFWMLVAPGSSLWRRARRHGLELAPGGLPYVTATAAMPRRELIAAMRALASHPRSDLFVWEDPDPPDLLGDEAPHLARPSGQRLDGAATAARVTPAQALRAIAPLRPGALARDRFVVAPIEVEGDHPVVKLVDGAGTDLVRLQLRPRGAEPVAAARTRSFDLVRLPVPGGGSRIERTLVRWLAAVIDRNDRS